MTHSIYYNRVVLGEVEMFRTTEYRMWNMKRLSLSIRLLSYSVLQNIAIIHAHDFPWAVYLYYCATMVSIELISHNEIAKQRRQLENATKLTIHAVCISQTIYNTFTRTISNVIITIVNQPAMFGVQRSGSPQLHPHEFVINEWHCAMQLVTIIYNLIRNRHEQSNIFQLLLLPVE